MPFAVRLFHYGLCCHAMGDKAAVNSARSETAAHLFRRSALFRKSSTNQGCVNKLLLPGRSIGVLNLT